MAGAGGFEPPNDGIKIRCLTTWRRPNTLREHEPAHTLEAGRKIARTCQRRNRGKANKNGLGGSNPLTPTNPSKHLGASWNLWPRLWPRIDDYFPQLPADHSHLSAVCSGGPLQLTQRTAARLQALWFRLIKPRGRKFRSDALLRIADRRRMPGAFYTGLGDVPNCALAVIA